MMIVDMSESGTNMRDVEIGIRTEKKGDRTPRVVLSCMPKPGKGVIDSQRICRVVEYIHNTRKSSQPYEPICSQSES